MVVNTPWAITARVLSLDGVKGRICLQENAGVIG
jgi:hypothetical protein